MNKKWALTLALMAGSALTTAEASVFYIDSNLSNITMSGSAALTNVGGTWRYSALLGTGTNGAFDVTGGGPLVQQGVGSLATSLSGTIDVSNSGGMLVFSGASVSANNNGWWRPDGSNQPKLEPAQLAGQITPNVNINFTGNNVSSNILSFLLNVLAPDIESQYEQTNYLAARSIELNVIGSSALNGGGLFDVTPLVAITSGAVNLEGLIDHTWMLDGLSGAIGSGIGIYTDGGVNELILPFDLTLMQQFSVPADDVSYDLGGFRTASFSVTRGTLDVTTRYVGQIVAVSQTTSVPEPATFALVSLGLAGLSYSRRARKAK